MKKFLIGFLLFWASVVFAQNPPVIQSGPITPGHAMQWNSNGVAQDAGPATNGTLTSLGVTNNGGPGICINSAPITTPFNELCLAVSTGAAAQISLQNFGGAQPQNLNFSVNGTLYTFPFVIGGIVGPASTTIGSPAVWGNGSGTLLAQGAPPSAQGFSTRTAAVAATIPSTVQLVQTAGFAAVNDGGGALYIKAGSLPACGFTSADGAFWQVAGSVFNWKVCGAAGDGVTNDTAAIQASINAAQTVGGISYGPGGNYILTTGLSVTKSVNIQGAGYVGPFGQTVPLNITQLLPAEGITTITISSDEAVILEKFAITFSGTNTSDNGIIVTNGTTGVDHFNQFSVFRDFSIAASQNALTVTNGIGYIIDNGNFYNARAASAVIDNVNFPGYGDISITNSTFTGTPSLQHLRIETAGGLRVVNNKFSGGANAIVISPYLTNPSGPSPLIIANNSIEAFTSAGILMQRSSGTGGAGSLAITGNEFQAGAGSTIGINLQASGGTPWIIGGTISSNIISTSTDCIAIDGSQDINVVGNTFRSCTTSGLFIGATTTNIGNTGNLKGAGVP